MKTNINIAEILKDKPRETKLYSLTFGDCSYQEYTGDFGIECQSQNGVQFNLDEYGKCCIEGECILFPSKEMHDWSKFAWKKGDVLRNDCGFVCIFKEWASDDYTKFNGCYFDGMPNAETAKYSKLDNDTARSYIRELEKNLGGKLNFETLEIEKSKSEYKFKPFDKVLVRDSEDGVWKISLFGFKTDFSYTCLNGICWSFCIPYEGNEHLCGTAKKKTD